MVTRGLPRDKGNRVLIQCLREFYNIQSVRLYVWLNQSQKPVKDWRVTTGLFMLVPCTHLFLMLCTKCKGQPFLHRPLPTPPQLSGKSGRLRSQQWRSTKMGGGCQQLPRPNWHVRAFGVRMNLQDIRTGGQTSLRRVGRGCTVRTQYNFFTLVLCSM